MTTSTRRIATVAAAVAVALVVVWYVALFRPQSHDVAVAHKARAAAEQQVANLDSQVARLQALVQQIPSDTARLQSLDAALPDNPSLATALDQLHQAATATGVTLSSVGPSTPASGSAGASSSQTTPGGPAITLAISVSGSYAQLMSFVSAITAMPRALVVDAVSVSGTSQLSASISGRIFYAGSPTP